MTYIIYVYLIDMIKIKDKYFVLMNFINNYNYFEFFNKFMFLIISNKEVGKMN